MKSFNDRRENFSELLQEFYQMMGIWSIKTYAYHPETDGMVERFNGILKAMLRKFLGAVAKYFTFCYFRLQGCSRSINRVLSF